MMDDAGVRLRLVRLFLGEQRMEVVVDDLVSGIRRRVDYQWCTKTRTDTPPLKWHAAILGEVKYQRGQDLKKKSGRALPWK